jgi:hypothetical protein
MCVHFSPSEWIEAFVGEELEILTIAGVAIAYTQGICRISKDYSVGKKD